MGRGPALKTKAKEIKKLAKAKYDAIAAWYKKHPQFWFQERLKDIAKNTGVTDVAKLGAILGMTLIVKNIIESTEDLSKAAAEFARPQLGLWKALGLIPRVPTPEEIESWEMAPEYFKWIISFCLAYLLVEHFGDIIRAMGDTIKSIKSILTGWLV